MHSLEHCHIYTLDLPSLVADGSRTPHEAYAPPATHPPITIHALLTTPW